MGDRKKMVCVSHSTLMGGAECAFFEMIEALCTDGQYDIIGIFPQEIQEGGLIDKCAPYLQSYHSIKLPWWFAFPLPMSKRIKLIGKIFLSALAIRKIIRTSGASTVIVNTISIPSAAIGGFLAGKPVHWFVHELGNDGFTLVFGERFSKRCMGWLSKKVLCNSHYIRRAYTPYIDSKKMEVVYQSVSIASTQDISLPTPVLKVGVVGRLLPQKNQQFVVDAIMQLVEEHHAVELFLIGADTTFYGEALKRAIEQKKASSFIHFLGVVHPITEAYKQINVLVNAGINEALGRTTIEAMKLGIPVVVANNYGHVELVEAGVTGLIFQENKIDDLMAQLIQLEDMRERKRVGDAGKQWAMAHFSSALFALQLKQCIVHD